MTAASDRPPGAGSAERPVTTIPRGMGGAALTAAARETFAERGYHGASIRDIAKRAGLSLSALYYWHSSKQDLLAALIEDSINDYFQTCDAALRAAGPDPTDRLTAIVRATVDYRVRRRIESNIAAREARNLEPPHAERLDHLRHAATAQWDTIVDDGVTQRIFGCQHPIDARRAIQAACNAIAQWYDPTGDVGPVELADRYVTIALRIVDHQG
ncbi:MAG: TetR family transcriptional regulator [Pseudonocardiaceae bacterium]|nr:TetR family transcriptional regulator [Pseudonocardiaceae bacterium]